MVIYLKQSTASQEVPLGYFVDSTDGNTEETGLTIANTDIKIWKAGATTLADKNSGGATHISNGLYYTVLDATDTDTCGPLTLFVHVSGALSVRVVCAVLPANIYDAWFSTTLQNVNVGAISGDATAADNEEAFFDGTGYAGTNNVIPSVTTVATCTTNTDMRGTDNAALATELAKVPKSDSTVTWNATALASIQTEANDALVANNLDHLLLTPVTEDMTDQCADGSIFGRFLTGGDTSDFISTDSIIDIHAAIVALAADVGDAGLGNSLVSKVDDITTEMAKVPKSDSNVTWNATALASINTEVDTALNTAIPESNTADSVNDLLLDLVKVNLNAPVGTIDTVVDAIKAKTDLIPASPATEGTLTTIAGYIDTEVAAILAAVDTEVAAIKAKTDNLPTSPAAVGSNMGSVSSVTAAVTVGTNNDKTGYALTVTPPTLAQIEASTVLAKEATLGTIDDYIDTEIATVIAELAKVPKSDSNVTWNATALASINAEVDTALNTAIPASNTSDSLNDILLDVLKVQVDDIHTDIGTAITNIGDVHNTDLPAVMSMLTDIHGTDLPAVKSDTAAILADTNELQTDWVNGGRLDLLLDGATAPSAATVADAVWDELLAGHTGEGTAGNALATASSGGVDPSVLADAICDEALSGHTTAGTLGKKLIDLANTDISGLATAENLLDLHADVGTAITAIGDVHATDLPAVKTVVDAIKVKTDNIPASPAAIGSAMTLSTDAITAAVIAADAISEIQSGLATSTALETVAGYLDTEVAAILADTNELQADWANGGRLDLILDAASAPSAADVADAIWDEVINTGHSVANSAGKILYDNLNAPVETVDTVVDSIKTVVDNIHDTDVPAIKSDTAAVLEDTGTTIPASIASLDTLLARCTGLNHENFRIVSPSYSNGKMVSCTVKIYPTALDYTNDTNPIAQYAVVSTYDGLGNMITYGSKKL